MIFISLTKCKQKPTRKMIAESNKIFDKIAKEGVKILGVYWTLGRYDTVVISEAKDEKAAMKAFIRWGDMFSFETLTAIPREEAVKLLDE